MCLSSGPQCRALLSSALIQTRVFELLEVQNRVHHNIITAPIEVWVRDAVSVLVSPTVEPCQKLDRQGRYLVSSRTPVARIFKGPLPLVLAGLDPWAGNPSSIGVSAHVERELGLRVPVERIPINRRKIGARASKYRSATVVPPPCRSAAAFAVVLVS